MSSNDAQFTIDRNWGVIHKPHLHNEGVPSFSSLPSKICQSE